MTQFPYPRSTLSASHGHETRTLEHALLRQIHPPQQILKPRVVAHEIVKPSGSDYGQVLIVSLVRTAPVHIRLTDRLLRTHVRRRAHGDTGSGEFLPTGYLHRPRDTKVRNDRLIAGAEDVLGFDVTVNHAAVVRVA